MSEPSDQPILGRSLPEPRLGHGRGDAPPAISATADYTLIKQIGRGSYGQVWLARNVTGSYRAVKIVYRSWFEADRPYEREFTGIKEFEPISRLHPGQVAILHVGRNDEAGYFFYVMELADDASLPPAPGRMLEESRGGEPRDRDPKTGSATTSRRVDPESYEPATLRNVMRNRPRMSVDECLEVASKLTDALQFLHAQGLVHRDIKPSNIIFVNGYPKLADIGLVARMDATLSYVGTEGFLPPEGPGKPKADIYSLGKVLYEMATGKDRTQFPEPPTLLKELPDREAFQELNEVILKACARDSDQRYHSAAEMRAELAALRAGASLRRSRLAEKRLALLSKVSVVGIVVTTLVTAAFFYQQHQTSRVTAERERTEAGLRHIEFQRAHEQFEAGRSGLALAYLAKVLRHEPANRVAAERVVSALTYRNFALPTFDLIHGAPVTSTEFSPDGSLIATGCEDRSARLFDATTGELLLEIKRERIVWEVHFSHDSSKLFTVTGIDGMEELVESWDTRAGSAVGSAFRTPGGTSPAWSHDTQWIARADPQGAVWIWNVSNGKRVAGPLAHGSVVNISAFSPDGRVLVTADAYSRGRSSRSEMVRVWDTTNGRLLRELDHPNDVSNVNVSPDGSWIVTGCQDGKARIWSVASGELMTLLLGHEFPVMTARFSPDGRRVVTASNDQTVRIWDARSGIPLTPPLRHGDGVTSAEFSPNGELVVSLSRDGSARLWDTFTGRALGEPIATGGSNLGRLSSDQRWLAIQSGNRVRVWDIRSGAASPVVIEPRAGVGFSYANRIALAQFDPSGDRLLTLGRRSVASPIWVNGPDVDFQSELPADEPEASAGLWDSESGLPAGGPLRHRSGLWAAAFSRDGRWIITGERNGEAWVWDAGSGEVRAGPLRHELVVTAVGLSPDGSLAATGCEDAKVRIWETKTGRLVRVVEHQLEAGGGDPWPWRAQIATVQFSPDGARLLTASRDRTAKLWEVDTGRELTALHHGGPVHHAAFGGGGDRMVTASLRPESAARVWDSRTGTPVTGLLQHDDHVLFAEFSADGARVVTSSSDRTARIWDSRSGRLVAGPLKHAWEVPMARFSPDGLRVVTASWDKTAQIWDAATGLPVSEPFVHFDWVNSAEFSSRGDRLATVSIESSALIWEVPLMPLPVPSWLPGLVEAVAGQRQDANGTLHSVPTETLLQLRQTLARSSASNWYTRWARWFFADRRTRPVFPSATVPVSELVRRLTDQDSHESLALAAVLAPMDATVLARRAWHMTAERGRFDAQPDRGEWLARLAVNLAPHDADLRALEADVLERLGKDDEAQPALAKAFELSPENPNACWVKAFLLNARGQGEPAYAAFLQCLDQVHRPSAGVEAADDAYLNRELRELQAMAPPDAEHHALLASRKATDRGQPRNQVLADWLSRRAIELADLPEKTAFWRRRIELLRESRQLRTAITRPPKSTIATAGEPVTFEVGVIPDEAVAVQWCRGDQDLPGATNLTLTLSQVTVLQTGSYSVLVHGREPASRVGEISPPASLGVQVGDVVFGGLKREFYREITGNSLSNLLAHPKYPDQPDEANIVSAWEHPVFPEAHVGIRMSGHLIPPVSGDYVFYLSCDDQGALFLSDDESPAHKRRIASEPEWQTPRTWVGTERRPGGENVSPKVPLEAGRRYFVESVVLNSGGTGNLGVAWQMPGEPPPQNGNPPIPGQYLAYPIPDGLRN